LTYETAYALNQINPMEHIKFLIKINNVIGYILIATIVLSPIGFIQLLLGNLLTILLEEICVSKTNFKSKLNL